MSETNTVDNVAEKSENNKPQKTVMKNSAKTVIKIIAVIVLAALVFLLVFPLHHEHYKDGGTEVWVTPVYVICKYKLKGEGTHIYPIPYDLLLSGNENVNELSDLYDPETLWDKYEKPQRGISYYDRERQDMPPLT